MLRVLDLDDFLERPKRRSRREFVRSLGTHFLATVRVYQWNGSGPASTDITSNNTRCNADDTYSTNSVSNPITIPIPGSGSNYSYWKVWQLWVTSAPATAISNLRLYSDGTNSFGTGVTAVIATSPTYVQATGTIGVTGDQLTTGNYTGLTPVSGSDPYDFFSYVTGSPLSISGSIGATTGALGYYVAFQIAVDDTASSGATGQETVTYLYDES